MHWLSSILLAIQVISSLSIIVLVLLQQGKGADMGSSFGGGSAGSLFGASGAANFLSRTTKWAAIIFFASTGGLAWVAHHPTDRNKVHEGVMQGFEGQAVPSSDVPVVPGASQGAAVPAAPAAAPQPAQPQSNAVPSAPAASSGEPAQPASGDTKPAVPENEKPAASTASEPTPAQGDGAAKSAQ